MTTESVFWVFIIAASGGVLVFVGLLMEREREEYKNVSSFRNYKCRKCWGEWIVIIGILIEIILAGCSAIQEWKDNPQNQPISSISAKIDFVMQGTNLPVSLVGGQLAIGSPESEKKGTHTLYPLAKSDFEYVLINGSNTLWIIEFKEMPLTDSFSTEYVRDAGKWTVFELQVPFIPAGTQIISGEIVLKINTAMKTIKIKPQTIRSLNYFHETYLKSPTIGVSVFGQNRSN